MKEAVIYNSKIKLSNSGASQNSLYPAGTLLMVTRSGILRRTLPLAIIGNESTVNQDIKTINTPFKVLNEYLYWNFTAREKEILEKYQKDGTTVESIDFDKFQEIEILLPPIDEQKRIIQELKALLILPSEIESESSKISSLIECVRASILELAMRGKLVPQDPTEEPAAVMLKRINPKAKIITDNPHSWNIPQNWSWVRVKELFAPMKRKLPTGIDFKYIDIDSINNKKNIALPKIITVKDAPSRASRFTKKGDIVFSMVRPYLRNIAIVPEDDCIASTGFYVLSSTPAVFQEYAFKVALSEFFVNGLNSFMKGDNSPSINKDQIENFVIPLPPMEEQKRIVTKIKELYACLDEIEASLQS